MKQIEETIERFFNNKEPLPSKKWKAFPYENRYLFLYHYHHKVLIYDFAKKEPIFQWWEKPADKRGLYAALEYLRANPDRLPATFLRKS